VKQKLDRPAEARDLYTSSLFRKGRAYADAAGCPWFILSAQHGLVSPTTVVAPYDLRLSATSSEYKHSWGRLVLSQLCDVTPSLQGKIIEIHAGAVYVGALREGLARAGALVVEPLAGPSMGQRLAWYLGAVQQNAADGHSELAVPALVARLRASQEAVTPSALLASGAAGLQTPGLYSWWVDEIGASELSLGLAHNVEAGLIYAGLAGATRSRSGKKSTNTLWGRIGGMHLGGRHEFSTFRLSLGSILTSAWREKSIDETRLTAWMHDHLRVVTIPFMDVDALDAAETEVLRALDPPLNLNKMSASPVRERLSELRKLFGSDSLARRPRG
jgi:hypothetical protein